MKILFSSIFHISFILCFFLGTSCSEEKRIGPVTPENTTCIVIERSRLEDIQIFPADNPLNQDISAAPVDTRSADILNVIGAQGIHPDFGSGLWEGLPIGIPFILVCKDQSKIPVLFRANEYDGNYGNESDAGPYPIPLTAPIEGNSTGDSHVLAVDLDNKILYELYNARANAVTKQWEASGGAVWDLKINAKRPAGWTSADASGMAMLPLLVRFDEVAKGVIDHPIRFTLTKAKAMKAYTAPASHWSSGDNKNTDAPTPYGMRLRLKAGFDISTYSQTNRIILTALKKYGLIFSDIGSDFFISGAPDERWKNDDLSKLRNVKATDFEVIQMGKIVKSN